MPFCPDDFPGQYKRLWKRALFLFPIYFSSRIHHHRYGESASSFWNIVSSRITFISFIHSSWTNWSSKLQAGCLNPALTSQLFTSILYDSQYKRFRLKLTLKILKLNQYSHPLICFLPSLNITKATGLINLVIYCYNGISGYICFFFLYFFFDFVLR